MNLEINTLYKIGKYLLGGIILFFVLKYTTQDKLSATDAILIAIIAMFIFIIVGYINYIFFEDTPSINKECNSYCSIKEHMENTTNIHDTTDKLVDKDNVSNNTNINSSTSSVTEHIVNSDKISRNPDGTFTVKLWKNPQATSSGSRAISGVMPNEMQYSYTDYNSLPQNLNPNAFESGYSFLPPANWFPTPAYPPVCVAEKQCPVCPVYTEGTDVNLKEWNSSRRITPPDNINVNYIEDKLNSGR